MEGGQLHRAGVLRPHLKQDFFERVELAAVGVHVVLVHLTGEEKTEASRAPRGKSRGGRGERRHLVGHEEKALLGCEPDDILNALPALDLACQREGARLERVVQGAGLFVSCHLAAARRNCRLHMPRLSRMHSALL